MSRIIKKNAIPFKFVHEGAHFEHNAIVNMIMKRDQSTLGDAQSALAEIQLAVLNSKTRFDKDEAVSRILMSADNFNLTILEAAQMWNSDCGAEAELGKKDLYKVERQTSIRKCRMPKCTRHTAVTSYYWCASHTPYDGVQREVDLREAVNTGEDEGDDL